MGKYSDGKRLTGKLYDNNGNFYCDLENANGLIKEYDEEGGLEFEGEYLNGLRKGKVYDYDGKLYLKVNILMVKDGMWKNMILIKISYMN